MRIWLWGSTTAIAPIGASPCSSLPSPFAASVPAAPFVTLPPVPCLGCVICALTGAASSATQPTAMTDTRNLYGFIDTLRQQNGNRGTVDLVSLPGLAAPHENA